MSASWKLTAFAPKSVIQAALVAQEEAEDWDFDVVLSGFEVAENKPDDWRLDAYFPREPTNTDRAMVAALFGDEAPHFNLENMPETDWVTRSQQGFEPIRAGRFRVRTPEHQPAPAAVNFVIPASQAFGTGHHATTAGCLAMLDLMRRQGVVARNHADVGTGTGLLAFAAMHLWPRALATASDIDPVCAGVVADNAAMNGVMSGAGPGELTMVIADGMEHPLLQACGPYDLLIANILAGPLVELAPDFGASVTPGGNLLLAGLLETQESRVRTVYRRAGFRLARRLVSGDWSVLWLRRRARPSTG